MENTATTTSRLGIALGGGGSRAFIHLGVLKRLEEAGLRPGFVSGSSMGAVLGALYANDPHLDRTLDPILDYFRKSSLFGGLVKQDRGDGLHMRPGFFGKIARAFATWSVASAISLRKGLRSLHPVNKAIDAFFSANALTFEKLPLPFGCNALNLTDGRLQDFTTGDLAPALKAGVAIGLVFAPFEWHGIQYADAAPMCAVPVELCRKMGAKTVLAVDICAPLSRPLESFSGFDVVRRILSMQSDQLNENEIARADLVLRVEAADVFWGDFSRIDELVQRGYAAADTVLDSIRTALTKDQ